MNIVYQMWDNLDESAYEFADFDFITPETDLNKIGQMLVENYKTVGAMDFYLDGNYPMVHLIETKPDILGKEVTRVTHHMVKLLEVK